MDYEKMMELLRNEFQVGAYPGKDPEEDEVPTRSPFKVLISTVLSQRTKDVNTHKASEALFSEYSTPKELAEAPLDHVKELIEPSGFYNVKSERVKRIARRVHEEYDDEVPEDMDELLDFKGVGRKTANCVQVYGFGEPAVPVDTHVHRISNRLGIADTKEPEETEKVLQEEIPKKYWIEINKLMVEFGKNICQPRNPKCGKCPLTEMCKYYEEVYKDEDR
ncbi:MAG: endonuclease III [Candidatus Thermoplasmatota archaeon]|nr:endonuclease III [Candidatus Thermoplasmatota archaeon]